VGEDGLNAAVVLVEPRNAGNVGNVARTMANFGVARLILAGPTLLPVEKDQLAARVEGRPILDALVRYDSLEAALAVDIATVETLKSGAERTLKQLSAAFEKHKVAEVHPLGEKFDPHRHQAISMVPSDAAPNTVVSVLQKGYVLHDRVLRPAMVSVAKAPDA